MSDLNRGTGRTTRILLKTLIKMSASPEKQVLVFAYSINYAKVLCVKLYDLCRFLDIPIKAKQLHPRSYGMNVIAEDFSHKIIVEDHYIGLTR
jgi:hypothetical protein